MKQTQKLNAIVVAMLAISHNRVDYPAGTVFEAPEKDVMFLKMAKYVREPTADELKAYEERQTLATVTATEPDNTDHAGLQPQPPSDSEPVTAGGLQGKVVIDELNHIEPKAPQVEVPQPTVVQVVEADPETVQAETIGAVKIPPSETPVEEAVDPEPVEAAEPEPEVTKPEPVEPASVPNPYDGWLKADLNAELDKRGIEHDAYARNDDLEALLMADDATQADA